ncbi:aryl-sulfate sulfotransferase [candidate division KSB1 bacterium]|nr:aryl-sulfate sulfotransferase [candidate division KSB1 bacterium]
MNLIVLKSYRTIIIVSLLCWQAGMAGVQPVIQYLFPKPGTDNHPKETVIIVRFNGLNPDRITNLNSFIDVSGNESGTSSGQAVISSDEKTIIFKPDNPFHAGERVSVRIAPVEIGQNQSCLDSVFHFSVGHEMEPSMILDDQMEIKPTQVIASQMKDPVVINGVSIPSDFPWVDITVNDNPDSGYIFISHLGDEFYNMILDNNGAPIWYHKTQSFGSDFKVQKNGLITARTLYGYGNARFIAMDSTYAIVDTFYAPPGYLMNDHDILLLDNGHYLCIADDYRRMDLSGIVEDGHPNAFVTGNTVVEMDGDDNPVFIWRCWDYFTDITDAEHVNLSYQTVDYVHMNAVDLDLDGHILISSRHLSEVTKINRETGEIIWRLGGVNHQFEWTNDEDGISYQHDIRVLPNGNYTVFDNGVHHDPPHSRALEFSVDTSAGTATRIWEYRESPDRYATFAGNVQRLPSGNTLINWAMPRYPKPTEVRPDGSKAFEMDFTDKTDCYRIFRFPWQGNASKPYLMIEPGTSWITLLFNKFGDPDVAHYNIYGGTQNHPNEIIATSTESFIHLTDLTNNERYYFRIKAENTQGVESAFSNEETIQIQFTEPEENLVRNGDFSQGLLFWDWNVTDGLANHEINALGELHFQIQTGGAGTRDIQAKQQNIQLIQDRTYQLKFDAYADAGRTVEFEIIKEGELPINYSQMGLTFLNQIPQHFSHDFVMDHPSEIAAQIVLNVGGSDLDVYIDNISLKEVTSDVSDRVDSIPEKFHLSQNYPNPFNPETRIRYTIPRQSHVTLSIYNITGQLIDILIDSHQNSGEYSQTWNASDYRSGVYYYRLKVSTIKGHRIFENVKKMIFIK